MVAEIQINAKVNGKLIPQNRMGDPFDIMAFPGAVDASRGRTLEKLGKDISVVTRMLAKADPDIEDISVEYKIQGEKLIITSNQKSLVGIGDYGEIYRDGPKLHVFTAAMSVLHGKGYRNRNTLNDISFDIVKTWKQRRSIGGRRNLSTPTRGEAAFNNMSGLLSTGLSLMGVL
jgi:hypothetical protein